MKVLYLLLLALTFSCSEPYDFGPRSYNVLTVNGKVSSLEGRSFVKIYRENEFGDIFSISNFNLKVTDQNGNEDLFLYNDSLQYYIPSNSSFVALEGNSYSLSGMDSNGIQILSDADSVGKSLSFSVSTKDTVNSVLTPGNIIQNRPATAVFADLNSSNGPFYSRMKFYYEYQDFFYRDRRFVELEEDQFALFECSEPSCDPIKIPVGYTTQDRWYFFNDSLPGCELARDTTQVLQYCFGPCCRFEEDWFVDIFVYAESVSQSTYNFWEGLEKLRSNDGLLFDTYPFQIQGNVECIGCQDPFLGQFSVVAETIESTTDVL